MKLLILTLSLLLSFQVLAAGSTCNLPPNDPNCPALVGVEAGYTLPRCTGTNCNTFSKSLGIGFTTSPDGRDQKVLLIPVVVPPVVPDPPVKVEK